MKNYLKAIRLLRYAADSNHKPVFQEVRISHGKLVLSADLYLADIPKPSTGMLFLHGFVPGGNKDSRVRQIASGFQAVGFTVLVPNFPDSEQLKINPRLVDQVVGCFSHLIEHPNVDPKRSGIFGVSYGGTMGFLAAAHPMIRNDVKWVGALGAYASMRDIVSYSLTGCYPTGGPKHSILPDPYAQRIFELNFGKVPNEASKLISLFEENVGLLSELSIEPDLNLNLSTRVILAHSEHDSVIPCQEMDRLHTILKSKEIDVRKYLIQMKEHARVTRWFSGIRALLAARAIVSEA